MNEKTFRTNQPAVQTSSSSAGIASPNQMLMGTSAGIVTLDNGLTSAPRPWTVELELVLPLVEIPQVQAAEPAFKLEQKWRRMAANERKKVRKRGLKPSDVDEQIGTMRYER